MLKLMLLVWIAGYVVNACTNFDVGGSADEFLAATFDPAGRDLTEALQYLAGILGDNPVTVQTYNDVKDLTFGFGGGDPCSASAVDYDAYVVELKTKLPEHDLSSLEQSMDLLKAEAPMEAGTAQCERTRQIYTDAQELLMGMEGGVAATFDPAGVDLTAAINHLAVQLDPNDPVSVQTFQEVKTLTFGFGGDDPCSASPAYVVPIPMAFAFCQTCL